MNYTEMAALIEDEGDCNDFDNKFARWVAEHYNTSRYAALSAVAMEQEYILVNKDVFHRRRHRPSLAQQEACRRINEWLWQAKTRTHPVELTNMAELAHHIISRRTASAWALVVGQSFVARRLIDRKSVV